MVFQSYALFNHLTVADNIKFGLQVGPGGTLVC
jgi:ABC-type Fe3+/spermidine/putrescine transport system ATPase subunit